MPATSIASQPHIPADDAPHLLIVDDVIDGIRLQVGFESLGDRGGHMPDKDERDRILTFDCSGWLRRIRSRFVGFGRFRFA